ncbi:hypothetical protein [Streptomyces sp. 5-10]|uniref:hypothetical protein n=1 Tax=Streptomyces sp. 5-10 TaxID=878925 RepID=UPI00168B2F9F|nr:hypothetical protein [Streptomyces sp. 5-10]MBD3004568.1 hypothetical protein [Streptomyces sp. 5-10]
MTERSNDYPTGNPNGMSFLPGTGWRYTGPEGYRVVFDGTGPDESGWTVLRYHGAHTSPVHGGRGLTEDDAHAMAARLAGQ